MLVLITKTYILDHDYSRMLHVCDFKKLLQDFHFFIQNLPNDREVHIQRPYRVFAGACLQFPIDHFHLLHFLSSPTFSQFCILTKNPRLEISKCFCNHWPAKETRSLLQSGLKNEGSDHIANMVFVTSSSLVILLSTPVEELCFLVAKHFYQTK